MHNIPKPELFSALMWGTPFAWCCAYAWYKASSRLPHCVLLPLGPRVIIIYCAVNTGLYHRTTRFRITARLLFWQFATYDLLLPSCSQRMSWTSSTRYQQRSTFIIPSTLINTSHVSHCEEKRNNLSHSDHFHSFVPLYPNYRLHCTTHRFGYWYAHFTTHELLTKSSMRGQNCPKRAAHFFHPSLSLCGGFPFALQLAKSAHCIYQLLTARLYLCTAKKQPESSFTTTPSSPTSSFLCFHIP